MRNYLWVFVNAQIENPSFDSQTKETMTLKQSKFGCADLSVLCHDLIRRVGSRQVGLCDS